MALPFSQLRIGLLCLVTLSWMFCASPVPAHDSAACGSAPGPRLVLPEPDYEAGRLEPGPDLHVTFPVTNDGEEPLHILRARPDCGCTVASFDREIPPMG